MFLIQYKNTCVMRVGSYLYHSRVKSLFHHISCKYLQLDQTKTLSPYHYITFEFIQFFTKSIISDKIWCLNTNYFLIAYCMLFCFLVLGCLLPQQRLPFSPVLGSGPGWTRSSVAIHRRRRLVWGSHFTFCRGRRKSHRRSSGCAGNHSQLPGTPIALRLIRKHNPYP